MIADVLGGASASGFVASLATLAALIGLPGYLLARLLVPRLLDSASTVVALTAVLGIGVQLTLAVPFLVLNGSLATLAIVSTALAGLSLLVLLTRVVKRHRRSRTRPGGSARRSNEPTRRRPEILALRVVVGAGFLALLVLVVRMASIRSAGDLWIYLSYVRAYADLPTLDASAMADRFYDARMALSGWLVLQALIAKIADVEPVDLHAFYLPAIWTVVGMAGFLFLCRTICRREACALFCCGVQILYLFSSLVHTVAAKDPGFALVFRINEDKIAVWLVLFPPTLALCLRLLEEGSRNRLQEIGAAAICAFALGITHPIGVAMLGLSLGSFGIAVLLKTSILRLAEKRAADSEEASRPISDGRRHHRMLLVALAGLVLLVPVTWRAILADSGFLDDLPAGWRAARLTYERFMDLLPDGRYRASSVLMDHPLVVSAFWVTPLLALFAIRSRGPLFLISSLWIPTVLLYSSWSAPLLGSFLTVSQLWRLHWVWPVSIALGFVLYRSFDALRRGLEDRPSTMPLSNLAVSLTPALGLLLMGLLLQPRIVGGLWSAQQAHDHRSLTAETRTVLEELGRQARPEARIVASPALSLAIPAFVSRARVINPRTAPAATAKRVREWERSDSFDATGLKFLRDLGAEHVVLEVGTPLEAHLARLTSLFSRSNDSEQLAIYGVLSLHPDDSTGDSLFARGDLAGALEAYRNESGREPAQAMVHYALGRVRHDRRDFPAAAEHYRRSVALDPQFLWPRLSLSEVLVGQAVSAASGGSSAGTEALSVLNETVNLWPGQRAAAKIAIDGCRALGTCRLAESPLFAVLENYRLQVEALPDSPQAYLNLAEAYEALDERGALRAVRAQILERWPSWGQAYSALARDRMFEGKETEATALLEQAVARAPDLFSAHRDLVALYGSQGRVDDALALVERRSRSYFRDWWPSWLIGGIHLDWKGDPRSAIPPLEHAAFLEPSLPQIYRLLDRAYRETGDLDRAATFYRERLHHGGSAAAAALAGTLMEQGDLDSAVSILETRLEAAPEARELLVLLDQARAMGGAEGEPPSASDTRPGRSVASLRRAVAFQPFAAGLHIRLGEALRAAGNVEEARRALERAARLDPTSTSTLTTVGERLMEIGSPGAALPYLEAAALALPRSPRPDRLLRQARAELEARTADG